MTVAVGILIGLVLGLTGAGGSVLAVPMLMLVLGLSSHQAVGISLGAVALSASFGVFLRLKYHEIQWLPAVAYSLLGSLFAPVGNSLGQQITPEILLTAFAVLVFAIAIRMWIQASNKPSETKFVRSSSAQEDDYQPAICRLNQGKPFKIGLPCIAGIGGGAIATGLLSGLFGVGGGFLIIPTLLALTGINIRQAVATSLVIIALISSSGFLSFIVNHNAINTSLFIEIAGGGLLGMLFGFYASRYITGPILQKIFAILIVLLASINLIHSYI